MEFCSREPTSMMTPSLAGVENRLEQRGYQDSRLWVSWGMEHMWMGFTASCKSPDVAAVWEEKDLGCGTGSPLMSTTDAQKARFGVISHKVEQTMKDWEPPRQHYGQRKLTTRN